MLIKSQLSLFVREIHVQVVRHLKNRADSLGTAAVGIDVKPVPSDWVPSVKITKELKGYFGESETESILDDFPEKLLRKRYKVADNLYLADRKVAKKIADHCLKGFDVNKPFLEVTPGTGLLSKILLKSNVNNLWLFEHNHNFSSQLKAIQQQSPSKVTIRNGDIVNLARLVFRDNLDGGNRFNELFAGIEKNAWTDEIVARMFIGTGQCNFFKQLINSIVFQNCTVPFGRFDYFVVLPPTELIRLTCSRKTGMLMYRSTSMLFQIFYECHFIERLPKKAFLPWQYDYKWNSRSQLAKFDQIDSEYLYLVHIVPRRNLYDYISIEDLSALWFFIKQNCVSRKNRVIPQFEKWIPGSGYRLIVNSKKSVPVKPLTLNRSKYQPSDSLVSTTISSKDYFPNFNIFTEFGELSPTQMLTLFTEFKSWPEYRQCQFLPSMDSVLLKMEHTDTVLKPSSKDEFGEEDEEDEKDVLK